MVRIVVSALLLVLLAVLVSFNLSYTGTFSFFGIAFEGVPIMAIALVSFAAGVVYSLILYLGRTLHERRKKDIESRNRDLDRREKELAQRSAAASAAAARQAASGQQAEQIPREDRGRKRAKGKGLLDRLKSFW